VEQIRNRIEQAWEERELLQESLVQDAIRKLIDLLDQGKVRVASSVNGDWVVHEWVKKGVILYFLIQKMETIDLAPLEFHDKIPLKKGYADLGVRVVPHALARYGSYLAKGVIMMAQDVSLLKGSGWSVNLFLVLMLSSLNQQKSSM